MNFRIRNAMAYDLHDIRRIEKRSYPPELQAHLSVLEYRLETFLIRVAETRAGIVGFYTCVPALLELSDEKALIKQLIQNRKDHYRGLFDLFRSSDQFNALYVTSTAVASEHQGIGIGRRLVEDSLELTRNHELERRASVLRMPGYRRHDKRGISAEEYLRLVKSGEIDNPILRLYLELGFALGPTIPDYEPDRSSMNYGVFALRKLD
ncbi:MAG: GNAT family N-acetyltransferase [Candidatus Aenigmarchaeota archaeon]|nr:GNAT family N-acetyltransferase [Candidatus Aenigmarchaeota archaeon]